MFAYLEIILQIIDYIFYGLIVWFLWPVLSALISALNAVVHFFGH